VDRIGGVFVAGADFFFFFFTLVTGPRRFLGLRLLDKRLPELGKPGTFGTGNDPSDLRTFSV